MKANFRILSALIFFVMGCDKNPVIPQDEQIVLQAYLYANQPVSDITVMFSRPLTSSDTANALISTASVYLYKNTLRYPLTPSMQNPGKYYYSGSDLSVLPNDQFTIVVQYNGIVATAMTTIPMKPQGLTINQSTMTFTHDTVTARNGGIRINVASTDSLVISWSNPTADPYYVVVESVDSSRQDLRSDTLSFFRSRRFVTQPSTLDHFRIIDQNMTYTGRHKVTLFRVNPDYVNLYKSRQQDSRSLNEPLTNVSNGLGIFTAFASDSVFINVVLQ